MGEVVKIISPGTFSEIAAADNRRMEFDYKNELLVGNETLVDFVFIGDSIFHLWELGASFDKSKKLIVNRGIGGDVTKYLLKRLDADVLQLKPACAVVLIGVNDTSFIETDTVCASDEEILRVENEMKKNISDIAKKICNAGISLALCTILPTNIPGRACTKERNALISRVNEHIRIVCKENNAICIDYYSLFVDSDGVKLKDGFSHDGLHPHILGYRIMADELKKSLEKNGILI